MKICTFFGHHDCSNKIYSDLRSAINTMIDVYAVNTFYVGHQGMFDHIALSALCDIAKEREISFSVVLAYLTANVATGQNQPAIETIFPEGIEFVPKRYAISYRNRWLLNRCDYVISHIVHSFGGAYQFAQKAKKQGKVIINIR